MLYNASAIAGSGPITGVGLQVGAVTGTAETYTYTMKLGHSNLTNLTATWANNINVGNPVTVANSVTFTVPAGTPAGEFIWLPMPSAVFTYNGTDNLVVELTIQSASGNVTLYTHPTTNVNRAYGDPASATAFLLNNYTHQIALRFNGGTMDVIGANSGGTFVFDNVVGGRQFLLRAAELGTSGSINKFACRLSDSTTASSFPSFTVTLAHTTQTALVVADATNIAGGTMVYNATFNMPAGLAVGDWVEIPFSTPFSYNGIDSLVVQTTTGAGSGFFRCQLAGPDAVRFLGRAKAAGGSSPVDFRGSFRFWVNK
jgi:hypothetical protein